MKKTMQLQSILLPQQNICTEESLYFHRERERILFDGYFNLFYIEKRKKHTDLRTLELYLNLQGYESISLMHDREVIEEQKLTPEERKDYIFRFPYEDYDVGVFWFALQNTEEAKQEATDCCTVEGFYSGESDTVRDINIAVDICTFHREEYVARNLQSLKSFLDNDNDPKNNGQKDTATIGNASKEAADHLHIFLIDNGQTLDQYDEITKITKQSNGRITVIPNRNIGGAGGFTRGMVEAIRQKEAESLTHVLLMDDDAVFDPDLFVRLYGFLTTLKQSCQDITVGGSLLREDYPYIQQACGEWFSNFRAQNAHPMYDLRNYENCTADFMCRDDEEYDIYSGWWCCCFSLNVVTEENLPLPMFLHHDDVSYGLMNADAGITFLNGIGVWHKGFETVFPGANRYYDMRNPLISAAIAEPGIPTWKVILKVWAAMTVLLMEYRYAEAFLTYRGAMDFCKGPEWLCSIDSEKLHQKVRSFTGKHFAFVDYQTLDDKKYEKVKETISKTIEEWDFNHLQQVKPMMYGVKKQWWKMLLLNGWVLPGISEPLALSVTDQAVDAFRRKELVLYEPVQGRAHIARRDRRLGLRFLKMYADVFREFRKKYRNAVRDFHRAAVEKEKA